MRLFISLAASRGSYVAYCGDAIILLMFGRCFFIFNVCCFVANVLFYAYVKDSEIKFTGKIALLRISTLSCFSVSCAVYFFSYFMN